MSIPKQPFKAVIQRCLCGNPAEKRTGSGWSCMRCINSQKAVRRLRRGEERGTMSDQETREQLAGAAGSAMAGRTFDARDHHGRILRWRIECEPLVSKCGDEFVWAVVVAEYRQGIAVPPRGRKPTPKPWPVIKLPVDVLPNAEVRDRRPGASDLSATAIGGSLH